MKKSLNKQKGFTLLETLVAIFILTLSITGPVYISSLALHNTINSRDNISAQYIAEEVVEVIRNKRDNAALQSTPLPLTTLFPSGVTCLNSSGDKCIMKLQDNGYVFELCPTSGCPNISFDPESDTIVYGKDGVSSVSKFVREFYLETTSPSETKLVVNIKWQDKGQPKIYSLVERLYPVDYRQFFGPGI